MYGTNGAALNRWRSCYERQNALASILLLVGSFCFASLALSQSSPPTSDTAKQTEALVDKAAALFDSKGRGAFSEFKTKGSEWFHGDTYLFVYDLNANVLLNPPFQPEKGRTSTARKIPTASCFMTP
jgi:hypothetical protein